MKSLDLVCVPGISEMQQAAWIKTCEGKMGGGSEVTILNE
jgi:hypothetical protein